MKKLLAMLFVLMLILTPGVAEEAESAPILEVHQMVLGYADGYYIRCGDIEIMIDGGKPVPFANNDDVMNNLRALGADALDMYIVTHWHLDHCENVNAVLEAFGTAETVVYSPSAEPPAVVKNERSQLQVTPLANGVYKQMKIDDVVTIGPLTFTCTGPENGGRNGTSNPDSLNFVLQYGTRRMLFTGDYAASGAINKRFPELCGNVDVLKFPHHGGKPYVIGNNAIRTTSPEYVLVPSLLNNYQLYEFIRGNGVDIKRDNILTQREGHVVILTDGGDYLEAKTQQNPADYAPQAN